MSDLSHCEEENDTNPPRSVDNDEIGVHRGGVGFQSHLPRPTSTARSSGSSNSSTNGKIHKGGKVGTEGDQTSRKQAKHTADASDDDSSSNAEEEEHLLASLLNSGISKSKSEPSNLKNSALLRKSSKQSKNSKKPVLRNNSKSPRNSTIIPGVRQTHLKLIPTSPLDTSPSPKWQETKTKMTLPIASSHQMAISDMWADESPNVARGPSIENDLSKKLTSLSIDENDGTKIQNTHAKDTGNEIVSYVSSLEDTLTASRVLELEANRVAQSVQGVAQSHEPQYMNTGCIQQQPFSMADSVCSNLSGIQPPSVMDSLISISGGNGDFLYLTSNVMSSNLSASGSSNVFTKTKEKDNVNSSPAHTESKADPTLIECRHTLGAKKGAAVPEVVRRALGSSVVPNNQTNNVFGQSASTISSSYYDDLTSSLSSCQSNLDNIKPPTIMDDPGILDQMDNSILSIASISSEIAPFDGMEKSTGPGKINQFEVIYNNDGSSDNNNAVNKLSNMNRSKNFEGATCEVEPISEACCTALEDIAPPTLMDDVSGCSQTLIAEKPDDMKRRSMDYNSDQTYTVQGKYNYNKSLS